MNPGSASKADAAVAISAALNVTEPSSCGLGGYVSCHLYDPCARLTLISTRDGFCLFYGARTKEVNALNGSGRSPEKLTVDYIRRRGITGPHIPSHDLNSVTVPGVLTSKGTAQFLTTGTRMRWPVDRYR